ncbi:Asp_protease_2 domain-containing protein, partial [Cephalotus follicularis]
ERKAKGLCFDWNEKFRSGHRCRKLFSIEGSLAEENDEEAQEDVEEVVEEVPEISINAIYGARTPQTMRVIGSLGRQGHKVNFLIDSGSTHSFLNHNIAKKNGLKPNCEGKFEVAVAIGEKLSSAGHCKEVCMTMQGVPLKIDIYLLPLEG